MMNTLLKKIMKQMPEKESEKCVIYLRDDQIDMVILQRDGRVVQHMSPADPQQLAILAAEKKVIVIVPAMDVLLTQLQLPTMSRTRLLQAIPFALEDQLIADVDTLHFVAGERAANGDLPIAVVAKEKMQHWLMQLKAWQIEPHILVSAVFAVPLSAAAWSACVSGDEVIVRTAECQGFGGDRQHFSMLLKTMLQTVSPKKIEIKNYSNKKLVMDKLISYEETIFPQEQMLVEMAHTVITTPAINLLQDVYAAKKPSFFQKGKMGKAILSLTVTWVLLLFLYPLGSYFILQPQVDAVDAQIKQIYQQHFPQAKSIVAPKMRLQEKLQKEQTQAGANRFLLLLGYIADALTKTNNIQLKRFDFQNNQLTLEVMATSSDDFSAFTQFLTQQGLAIRQQNVAVMGAQVNASLTIE